MKLIPEKDSHISMAAVLYPALISMLLGAISIFILGSYGATLFALIPLFIGFLSTRISNVRTDIGLFSSIMLSMASLFLADLLLFMLSVEGLVCIIMALPITILATFLGSLLAYKLIGKQQNGADFTADTIALLLLMPMFMSFDNYVDEKEDVTAVTSSVVVEADIEDVWNEVVAFSPIDVPLDFIFRSGISYPIDARIEGEGVGAIRYCNFNTGSFVEPITVWDEPHHLAFDVEEQPIPMTELSPYDIRPQHLHGYFVSKRGEFRLTEQADGTTLLEGTTWYYQKIYPAFYWNLWSDMIIHNIHDRVLGHIKAEVER